MVDAKHTAIGTISDRGLGLSASIILLLAAIRVPLHDLGIVPDGSVIAGPLVFVSLAVWLTVALRRRTSRTFAALTVVGLTYGVMLALVYQLLWVADGSPPSLGGVLAPGPEAIILRTSAFSSSIVTGTLVGAVVGLVAWAIDGARRT